MAQRRKLLAKALPSTVEDRHVIKATHLGWQENGELTMMPGYLAAVITYDAYSGDDPGAYSVHLMRTATPDGRWLRIESRRDLFHGEAEGAFAEYDKLAIRPGRI